MKQDMKVTKRAYIWFRWLVLPALVLLIFGTVALRQAYATVEAEKLVGDYTPGTWLPPAIRDDPKQVELRNDGWLRVRFNSGRLAEGQWTWDAGEKWIRCTLPELDYRIHAFASWTGIQLKWVLAIDPEEYSEEVSLKRTHQ